MALPEADYTPDSTDALTTFHDAGTGYTPDSVYTLVVHYMMGPIDLPEADYTPATAVDADSAQGDRTAERLEDATAAPDHMTNQYKASEPAAPAVTAVRRFSLRSLF